MIREHLTAADFEHIASQPENRDKRLEWIGGEIVEVVSNSYSSQIGITLGVYLGMYVLQNKLGRLTGADGGYIVGDERYIPDVAYVSFARQPETPHTAYNPIAPDLAVEVLSPNDDHAALRIKIVNYLRAGTTVWVVDPERQQVEVYAPDQAPRMLRAAETLDGGAVLPGFSLPLKTIFPDPSETAPEKE
jgi:Uma2 family endonuclease